MVRRDMERDLRLYGGVSNIGPLVPIETAEAEPAKPRLNLICTRFDAKTKKPCDFHWEADAFTACPKCGERKFVQKAVPADPVVNLIAPNPLEAI